MDFCKERLEYLRPKIKDWIRETYNFDENEHEKAVIGKIIDYFNSEATFFGNCEAEINQNAKMMLEALKKITLDPEYYLIRMLKKALETFVICKERSL